MGDVIKSFLVSLGFGVDDSSLSRFNKAIASASLKVTALYATIKVAAAGIFFGISKISEGFEQMGYELRLIAPPITKVLQLRQEMMKAYAAAGINLTKAVQQSVLFNFSLAKTKYALDAIYKGVGIRFLPLLTKQMDIFRGQIYANMPKITNALTHFVNFIFKAFEATTILGGRVWKILEGVYGFFKDLDAATEGWSTIILGVVAAWKFLNLSFLATPFGLLITGLTTILALWDDFKTFQEGGKSLFNWGAAIPTINAITSAFQSLFSAVDAVFDIIGNLYLAFLNLANGNYSGFADSIKDAFDSVINVFTRLYDAITSAGTALSGIGGGVASLLQGLGDSASRILGNVGNLATNLVGGGPASAPLANPLGSGISNSTSNQNVNQATSIVVQGSADASATGKAVAGQQDRVNFDLARNMKGATR